MRPNSEFLKDLNQDLHQLNQLNFTSIWTPFDGMILPANSSQLPVGQEIKLDILLHAWMVRDPRSLKTVAEVLSQPIKSSAIKP